MDSHLFPQGLLALARTGRHRGAALQLSGCGESSRAQRGAYDEGRARPRSCRGGGVRRGRGVAGSLVGRLEFRYRRRAAAWAHRRSARRDSADPPLRFSTPADLDAWAADGRRLVALVPELDDFLRPAEARKGFSRCRRLNSSPPPAPSTCGSARRGCAGCWIPSSPSQRRRWRRHCRTPGTARWCVGMTWPGDDAATCRTNKED